MLKTRRTMASRTRIRREEIEDHRSDNLMLKGTHLSMVIVILAINLDIRQHNVGVE